MAQTIKEKSSIFMGKKDDLKNFIEELGAIKNIAVLGKKGGSRVSND